jgi:5-methylcytosine-specific restriction protein A
MWKPCAKPGCPNLTHGKYCEAHAHLEAEDKAQYSKFYDRYKRDGGAQKFYQSAEWRKLRALKISQTPYCERCYKEGRMTPAEVVDHIVEISDDPSRRLDPSNLAALCIPCHNKKTAESKAGRNNKNN